MVENAKIPADNLNARLARIAGSIGESWPIPKPIFGFRCEFLSSRIQVVGK
jgi:hypothetical protein